MYKLTPITSFSESYQVSEKAVGHDEKFKLKTEIKPMDRTMLALDIE